MKKNQSSPSGITYDPEYVDGDLSLQGWYLNIVGAGVDTYVDYSMLMKYDLTDGKFHELGFAEGLIESRIPLRNLLLELCTYFGEEIDADVIKALSDENVKIEIKRDPEAWFNQIKKSFKKKLDS